MIRKDYLIEAATTQHGGLEPSGSIIKQEIIALIDKAFSEGAIVELKIIEGETRNNEGKSFSKLRFDITSNTDFDKFNN